MSAQPNATNPSGPNASATPFNCTASDALKAACKTAIDFGTYDYRTFKIPGWAFLDDLTATYRGAYIAQSAGYPEFLANNQAVSTATVNNAFTKPVDDTTVAASVTVSLHATGAGAPVDTTETLAMILVKQANGTWLADMVTKAK